MEALPHDLTNLDSLKSYEAVKRAVLEKYGLIEHKTVEQLLSNQVMGDQSPSEFFAQLKHLAGDNMSARRLTNLWKRLIPQKIVVAITPIENNCELDMVLSTADKIWENLPRAQQRAPSINYEFRVDETHSHLPEEITRLRQQVANLTRTVNRFKQSGKRPLNPRVQLHSSLSRNKKEICYYHRKFGDKANNCQKYCPRFVQKSTSASSQQNTKERYDGAGKKYGFAVLVLPTEIVHEY